MIKSKWLKPYEITDRYTYNRFGEDCYQFFDPLLLKVADWLRDELGSVTCNDWHWNQELSYHDVYEWSGLRIAMWDEMQPRADGKKQYNPYSDHSLGNALDLKFKNHSAEYVRSYIEDNWDRIVNEVGLVTLTLERSVPWLHVSTRNAPKGLNYFDK